MLKRAYSILTVKSTDDDLRILEGIATTPEPDSYGDVVESSGAEYELPIAFLWQHDTRQPIGHVIEVKVTNSGIKVKVQLAKVDEPGKLKDRLDEAWQSLKSGLVRGLSIGFRPLEYSYLEDGSMGMRFARWAWSELSAVTIPANSECTIVALKSIDAELLAASGRKVMKRDNPPASRDKKAGTPTVPRKGNTMSKRTTAEHIASLEAKIAANVERMDAIVQKSVESGESMDDADGEGYDTIKAENVRLSADLSRARDLLEAKAAGAKPVVRTVGTPAGDTVPVRGSIVVSHKTEAPGIRFARLARCKAVSNKLHKSMDEVLAALYPGDELLHRTAVAVGMTSVAAWAGNLVGAETSVYADFAEFLRPQTILGKFGNGGVPQLRRVPFRTALLGQTTGGSGYWVGEGKGKPVTKFDFARTTLSPLKVANIAVVTDELLRDSSPSAETLLRDSLASALRERLDIDFINPAKTASAGVSPASITQSLTPIASTGNDGAAVREDVRLIMAAFIGANNAPTDGVWIMSSIHALALSLMTNALGQPEFPGISMAGGVFFGLPVITSQHVPTLTAGGYVILANASDIYYADDGEVAVDMSNEASLQIDDSPTVEADASPTATSMVSLWQTNAVAFRAEKTVNWVKRRAVGSVAMLSAVNWGVPAGS